jgi:hypothetical protein
VREGAPKYLKIFSRIFPSEGENNSPRRAHHLGERKRMEGIRWRKGSGYKLGGDVKA